MLCLIGSWPIPWHYQILLELICTVDAPLLYSSLTCLGSRLGIRPSFRMLVSPSIGCLGSSITTIWSWHLFLLKYDCTVCWPSTFGLSTIGPHFWQRIEFCFNNFFENTNGNNVARGACIYFKGNKPPTTLMSTCHWCLLSLPVSELQTSSSIISRVLTSSVIFFVLLQTVEKWPGLPQQF